MIAFDQFIGMKKKGKIDKSALQEYIFERCIKMKESSTLGCQRGY
jgi:hypothetical protein